MYDSIQDARRLFPFAGISAFPFFEAVWIGLRIILSLVPTYFTIIWDAESPARGKWDFHDEVAHNAREDSFFVFLSVHKGKRVVVVHGDYDVAFAPDAEKCGGYNIAEGGLGIVGYSFSERGGVVASAEEISLATEEEDEVAFLT